MVKRVRDLAARALATACRRRAEPIRPAREAAPEPDRSKKDPPGIALLATMLAVALMTIIVMDFTTATALGYLSAATRANEVRAGYLARSAIAVGLALLAQDSRTKAMAQANQTNQTTPTVAVDSLADIWAQPFPPVAVDGGSVNLSIVDEARKFDINQLTASAAPTATGAAAGPNNVAAEQLLNLFAILGVSPEIVPAIISWLSPANLGTQGGVQADFYLGLIPPYQPRYSQMPTIGDLRMVAGVDDATFFKLQNYLTVSAELKVNVNTAPAEVLACLMPQMASNPKLAQELVAERTERPFEKITDVSNLPDFATIGTQLTQYLTLQSSYFTITGMGNFAGARKLVFSTFRRNMDGTAALASWTED